MSEPQQLLYKQHFLGVECRADSDCDCAFCQSCTGLIDLANHLLSIITENDLKLHYNWLAMNLDGLFAAASEKLGEDRYVQ